MNVLAYDSSTHDVTIKLGSIWGLILFLEFLHQEGGDVRQGHDSMFHGPILPPATVKLDLYSRASWGMHAMPYFFMFFFFFGGGEERR